MKIHIDDEFIKSVEKTVKGTGATVSNAINMFLELEIMEKSCDNCANERGDKQDGWFGTMCIMIEGVNYCGHWVSSRYPITMSPWKDIYKKLKKR